MPDLAVMLELAGRIGATRSRWLDVERLTATLGDDELAIDVAATRLAILGAQDRLEQLIENPLTEMEVA